MMTSASNFDKGFCPHRDGQSQFRRANLANLAKTRSSWSRLTGPTTLPAESVDAMHAWLQIVGFLASLLCGFACSTPFAYTK